jgi:hypothetical protein
MGRPAIDAVPVPVVSFFPGDFRTVDELNKTVEENEQLGTYHLNAPLSGGPE